MKTSKVVCVCVSVCVWSNFLNCNCIFHQSHRLVVVSIDLGRMFPSHFSRKTGPCNPPFTSGNRSSTNHGTWDHTVNFVCVSPIFRTNTAGLVDDITFDFFRRNRGTQKYDKIFGPDYNYTLLYRIWKFRLWAMSGNMKNKATFSSQKKKKSSPCFGPFLTYQIKIWQQMIIITS